MLVFEISPQMKNKVLLKEKSLILSCIKILLKMDIVLVNEKIS